MTNRKIKFKAISKKTRDWVYGHYYECNRKHWIIVSCNDGILNKHLVRSNTVCQFIGELDAKGKELYEFDITNLGLILYNKVSMQYCIETNLGEIIPFYSKLNSEITFEQNIHDLKKGAN